MINYLLRIEFFMSIQCEETIMSDLDLVRTKKDDYKQKNAQPRSKYFDQKKQNKKSKLE